MGRDGTKVHVMGVKKYFNPRALVGRDAKGAAIAAPNPISIHAPLWGATRGGASAQSCHGISIHAPLWGATIDVIIPDEYIADFNPRALVGRDTYGFGKNTGISNFNPRALVGRD